MRKTWEGKLILAAVLLVTAAGLICLAIWRNRVSGPGLLFFFLLIAAAILGAAALLVVPALTWHDLPGLVVWVGGCWAVAAGLVWILRGNKV